MKVVGVMNARAERAAREWREAAWEFVRTARALGLE